MTEDSGNRPRPTPRPRPAARPSPRPRVAGARRERDESVPAPSAVSSAPAAGVATAEDEASATGGSTTAPRATARPRGARRAAEAAPSTGDRRRFPALVLAPALLCVAAAAGAGVLLWQRLNPPYVDSELLTAARSNVEALYAYDYEDSEGSVERKLEVLTGDLREQYEADLSQGGIIDTYEQVSATTRYEVIDVGVQQINESQDTATLVVFGQYVVQSVNSGQQEAPQGSECSLTPEGAQSCVQTLQLTVTEVDGDWKISEVTLLTRS
ncbi:hypothetical protein GCU60_10865 [Blastococcus saxobsidens]|uniref:Mce-associated membrane protein n=1 Tax=Blastococcus saxobsidens TaxID=138336 RepID=A0A6L9W2G9_9ACTN|nr:hypothetical protein [Blastococcus saxobsidens]NEK86257.1 hypothetical protein [Blastococcus saxobsidens]